jgi:hypothetical protein
VVNGVEYSSIEAMPPEARASIQAALAGLKDADGSGIPDILEQADSNSSVVVHQSSVSLNGREVGDLAALPAPLRSLVQQALGVVAEGSSVRSAPPTGDPRWPGPQPDSGGRSLDWVVMVAVGAVAGVIVAGGVWMLGGIEASRAAQPTGSQVRLGLPFIALVIGTTVVGIGLAVWLLANRGKEAAGRRQQLLDGLERVEQSVARAMLVLLAAAVGIVLAVGGWIITHMDAGSKSQGGQFYVGLCVLVVLGAIARTYSTTRKRLRR